MFFHKICSQKPPKKISEAMGFTELRVNRGIFTYHIFTMDKAGKIYMSVPFHCRIIRDNRSNEGATPTDSKITPKDA